MIGSQARAAQATAAVFVAGRRAGSAVLVDARYLVTAAHVLSRFGPDTAVSVSVDQIDVEFPASAAGGKACRVVASRVNLDPIERAVDVAVLDLGENPPSWLPKPVQVWPAARMPAQVTVFGYPLVEGPLNGVWREFTVPSRTTLGAVQLDWDDRSLVDLDSDTYFAPGDLRQFAAALPAQQGMHRPGPPGAAWTPYHAQPQVRNRLAAVIAARAERNFLVAAMAAVPLSIASSVIDPIARGFNAAVIPSGVGEALSKYLDQLPEPRRERERGLLTALAYARGAGCDDPTWLAFVNALGYTRTVADLEMLRRSPAADYLLQTTTADRGARPVTRLFHQALADELLATRHQPSDENALFDVLLGQAARAGWTALYLRQHAAEHAAAAERLPFRPR